MNLEQALKACIEQAELAQEKTSIKEMDVHCLQIIKIAIEALQAAQAQAEADSLDALRYRKFVGALQSAYDGDQIDQDGLAIYCSMQSGFKDIRTVKAEIIWQDTRDEALNLDAAIDKMTLASKAGGPIAKP